MKQVVAHKKIGALQGILLVAALVLVLIVLNYLVLGFLSMYIGNAASSVAFWVFGCMIAWYILRVYVVRYTFILGEDVLQLNRSYGKRERHIVNIYLNRLLFLGTPEEAKKRYPNAKKVRVVRTGADDPVAALVYKAADGNHVALFQPNDAIKAALRTKIKEK